MPLPLLVTTQRATSFTMIKFNFMYRVGPTLIFTRSSLFPQKMHLFFWATSKYSFYTVGYLIEYIEYNS